MADELSEIPDIPVDLKEENRRLKQKVSVLEKELTEYQTDGPLGFLNELNRWIVNSTELIRQKSTSLASLVSGEGKDFERMMVLIKNTKESSETVAAMKTMLGIKAAVAPGEKEKIVRVTPESQADVYGDNKQQQT